jgi:glyoxylase-like metal-dependent hydrolase (beta-lactamase superfamily II)
MEPVIPGLYASAPAPLPFAQTQHVRAFLLARDGGNLLVYSAPGVDGAAVSALGGVDRIYLNHWHEARFGDGAGAGEALGAPLTVHAGDAPWVPGAETFAGGARVGDDLELIPIPGHTPGATAFLWEGGGRRVLFTGDSVYLDDGEWVAAVLESSDRAAYLESLALLRELEFDLVVPWVATAGRPFAADTDPADARRRLDAVIARVRRGEDR